MTRQEFDTALTQTLLESLRNQAMKIVGNGLAEDAVQEALEDFPYQNFDLAGAASLSTLLSTRVRQRAFNLLDQARRFYSYSFQDSDDTGVHSCDLWEDVNKDRGETYLKADFQKILGESLDAESDDDAEDGNTAVSGDEEVDENEQSDDFYDGERPERPFDIIPATEVPAEIAPVFVDMLTIGEEQKPVS